MRQLVAPMIVAIPALVTLVVAVRTWLRLARGDATTSNEKVRWRVGASVLEFGPRSGPRLVYALLRGAGPGLLAFAICVFLAAGYLFMSGRW